MKKWLFARFLTMWAKETVLRDNKALEEKVRCQQMRIRELESYIRGLHKGLGRRPKREKERNYVNQ